MGFCHGAPKNINPRAPVPMTPSRTHQVVEKAPQAESIAKSSDTLFDGRVACRQHVDGYRFSIDAILAAHFSPPAANATLLDLGTGCGIIGLILMYRWTHNIRKITGIEYQEQLATLAQHNIRLNNYENKFNIIHGDIKSIQQLVAAESFSQVISNPPFYKKATGRTSSNKEAFIARHQCHCTLDDIVHGAFYAVKNKGKVVIIYPAAGLAELIATMKRRQIEPKRLQQIYSYPDEKSNGRLVLVEGIKNGGEGVSVLPPFYIYSRKCGPYSSNMQRLYAP